MHGDWPTQEYDLKITAAVIKKHVAINNGEPLPFLDIVSDDISGVIDYRIPDWIMELKECFVGHYGFNKGQLITNKVLTKCLLADHVVH